MAFRAAARLAMSEALPKAHPVLLEPIHLVEIAIPSEAISKASAIVSGRRGQILGYDGRPGWDNWDVLKALMPESEIADLIVELRSATSGVGTYSASLDHLAELSGKPAEAVMRKSQGAGMFRRARELGWMAAVRFLAPFLFVIPGGAQRRPGIFILSTPAWDPGSPLRCGRDDGGGGGSDGRKGRCGRANGGTRPGPPCGPDKKVAGHRSDTRPNWSCSGSKPENRPEGNGPTWPQHREGKAETTTGTVVYMRDGNPACNAYDYITAMRCRE